MQSREELLAQLNDDQRAAVEYVDGPQLVIAGAGSGKTRVLTYKIAYLLQSGMRPWNILALTFTNKAAKEMKERVGRLVGEELAGKLNMGTFHSVFSRILRVECDRIGFSQNFTIYDETDSRSLQKAIIKEMGLDDKVYKPAAVHHRISMAKNRLVDAARYSRNQDAINYDTNARIGEVWRIFEAYEQRCRQANAMDFDDLLVMTHNLFLDHEDVRKKYAERFQYVLVDEYQDTNYAQQQIVLQLTKERQQVCVVGDDAQSIYAFRGANIDNILNFQKVYPTTQLFKLEQNYRSTQRIVQAANSLIRKNARQIQKDVYSKNAEGEKLQLRQAYSDKEEAAIVCREIRRLHRKEGGDYSDFAVLYRTNAQSRTFEEEMRKEAIPYRIYGGMSFYQRKEIKDMIAYFRVVANPDDEEALKRIINYPARGIGNTTIEKLLAAAHQQGVSLWQVVCNPDAYALGFNRGALAKLVSFRELINAFISRLPLDDAYELGRFIIQQSGISTDIFSGKDTESISRQENLEEFLSAMKEFVESKREEGSEREVGLLDFLQEVSLMTDLDSEDGASSRVSLMTIHAAKGLEFPTVFVVGLEENIFPSPMSSDSARGLEEERRLFYVAITRAERHCFLTCAKNRWRFGKLEFDVPSRFLADIDPSLVEEEGKREERGWMQQNSRPVASQFKADPMPRIVRPRRPEPPVNPFGPGMRRLLKPVQKDVNSSSASSSSSSSSSAAASASSVLSEGVQIEHERFGIGTVIKVEGTGENTKATVEFRNLGTKQLLLKFARFKVIGR